MRVRRKGHAMKIEYTSVTGTKTEVEVTDDIGTMIVESRREEHAGDERERYHCDWSFDGSEYEGDDFKDDSGDPEKILLDRFEEEIQNRRLTEALRTLTPVQKRRLLKFAKGESIAQIASEESASFNSVKESIQAARKKMQKNLKKF